MSGTKRPPIVPESEIKRIPIWVLFFKRLISRTPQYDEVHLISTGIIYLGDSDTNGSWRIMRSGNNLVRQRLESGSWVTKGTDTP